MEDIPNPSPDVTSLRIETGDDILGRRQRETDARIKYPAFSRIHAVDASGKEHVFWLVERVAGDLVTYRTWNGMATGGVTIGGALREGETLGKHMPLGRALNIAISERSEEVDVPPEQRGRWAGLRILSSSHYRPVSNDVADGEFQDEGGVFRFLSLRDVLEEYRALEERAANAPPDALDEINAAKAQLEDLIKRQQARIRHIVEGATLRNQPKLDAAQIGITGRRIMQGQIVIDGAPGTGKTTTLLDRIGFLTDPSMEERGLPGEVLGRLMNPATAYVLFTPNSLLLDYLSEAMGDKGLLPGGERVKTWTDHREVLANQFGFLQANAKASRFSRDKWSFQNGASAFDLRGGRTAAFLSTLQESFIRFILQRHSVVTRLRSGEAADPRAVVIAQEWFGEVGRANTLTDLFRRLEDLRGRIGERVTASADQEVQILTELEAALWTRIRGNSELLDLVRETLTGPAEAPELDAIEASDETDGEDGDALETGPASSDQPDVLRILAAVRPVFRRLALQRVAPGVRLSGNTLRLHELLRDHIHEADLKRLAPIAAMRLLRQLVASTERTVLAQVGPFYAWARRRPDEAGLTSFLSEHGRELLEKRRGIGPDELDALLFLQLWALRSFHRSGSVERFERSGHRTVQAFKDERREVVAIDEATDFSALQLGCMSMLASPPYDCVTFSGDLMQRMTEEGIRKWEEYEEVSHLVAADVERVTLTTSYRHSPRLHSVTKRLYESVTGQRSQAKTPLPPSDLDPAPLLHVAADLDGHADWIAERVVEIRNRYEEVRAIPTIAVLVPTEDDVRPVARAIDRSVFLGDNINVEACSDGQKLGAAHAVRVFSVQHIKGLEFEAAFFYDLGRMADLYGELAHHMLYVGLSRASVYLGVTVSGETPSMMDAIEGEFEAGTWA